MERNFKFENGDEVEEIVTGFQGVITGTCFYLTGCNNYLVVPKTRESDKKPDGSWIDEGRLRLTEKGKIKCEDVAGEDNGADISPPTE